MYIYIATQIWADKAHLLHIHVCRYCFNLTRRQSPTYIQTYSTAIDLKYDPESFRYDPKTVQRPSLILQMLSARRIIPNSSVLSMSDFCLGISHIDLYQIVLLVFTVGRHIVKQCCQRKCCKTMFLRTTRQPMCLEPFNLAQAE